jgi:hypothetical protein
MRRKIVLSFFVLVIALVILPGIGQIAHAQDYSFSLVKEEVDVWIEPDGSVRLEYWLTFTCDPGAHPIDVVDLGLPTGDYSISGIRADVDGTAIDRVDSDYQGGGSYGVAVWLGRGTISPGRTGTVHIVVNRVGGMVYEDSKDTDYASTEFSPTWFDGDFVHGTTDMSIFFHLPAGIKPEEPRWHESPSGWPAQPDTALDKEGRVLYTWYNPEARPDKQYIFGASFPRQYVDEGVIQEAPSALGSILRTIANFMCNPVVWMVLFIIAIVFFVNRSQRRRRMQYLPPSMKVEGVGIKRGLTAVEAAILLETPLNRVLTMILFGLMKKGALTIVDDKPLKVEINEPLPEKLRPYEKAFLETVKKNGTLSEKALRTMMVDLIKSVNNKMKGFSRKESVEYYQSIVRRAWQQVEAADTPEIRGQRFGEGFEWAMLDDDFRGRTASTFGDGPVYLPHWWWYYRPWMRTLPSTTATPSAGPRPTVPSGPIQLPTLPGADFADKIVTGVGDVADKIVGSITDFTGGVTKVTNPPPVSSSSTRSSSSRSGGGCACACACACAGCACACAGGGR